MPCNAAPYPRFSSEDMDAVEIYYQAEIDRITKIACEAIKVLKRNALYDNLSDNARAWSHEHDAWDAARTLVERSVKATVRRSTFDDKGNEVKYDDGKRSVNEDDISALRSSEYGWGRIVDQELAQQVFEDILEEQQQGDDVIDEALANDAFVENMKAQDDTQES